MNQRLTRKEIKRDDFATVVGRGVDYAESHVRTLVYAIAGLLLLVALGVAFYFYRNHVQQGANEALAKAMTVYQAPIAATGAKPADPSEPSFPTEAARQVRAKELLQKVRDDFGSTNSADIAGLYLAQIAAGEGKLEEARELWTDFVDDHGDSILAGEARINLIDLDRKQGKGEQVLLELRGMLEKADAPLPQDVILNEIGKTLEQLKRPQEAVLSYQRIVDEFPQSPYHQEAQQKVTALDPARAAAGAGMGLPPGMQGVPGFPG
ncbi:MAG TPA: tetratricopeptide repeat protein [Thermoanaerobaculia bacterium]|nr:tetratricopeptide repeat protein [Thermoanaerobaculia bacterium]